LNERIIELIDIAQKTLGAQDTHLETIKILSQIKNCRSGNNHKTFGEKKVLDEFENVFKG
jgi:hypothetical protein